MTYLQYTVLSTPLPAAAKVPVGPFRFSIHPRNGSFHDATTMLGLITTTGRSPASDKMAASPRAYSGKS